MIITSIVLNVLAMTLNIISMSLIISVLRERKR